MTMLMLPSHPDRSRVLAELHARPFTAVDAPRRVLHFAFQTSAREAQEDAQRVEQLAARCTPVGPKVERRHLSIPTENLLWERHGEFVTYTIVVPFGHKADWPEHLIPPGRLLVAVDLRLVSEGLRPAAMVQASIADGRALISTDFAENAEGFVDITIINRNMPSDVAGATVQRVLETETYRCFALLGLPVAERAAVIMGRIEDELPSLMEKMDAASTLEDNRELLDRLTSMTVDLERSSASTHFRFGATKAYAELVRLRLLALSERPDMGGPGLASFLSRRFEPAIRTCATVSEREATLAQKLTRAAQLLRTRVEITLESQNRDLLETMGNRVRLQLRLQQTVEVLSVAAIAYYVASLFHLLVAGLEPVRARVEPELLTSLVTIPIIAAVAFAVRRVRRHHIDADPSLP